jgi:putative superfamily III holin-X
MADGGDEAEEKPIGELFGDLVEGAEAYARAELKLAQAKVESKADAAKRPALLGAAALLFLTAGVVVLSMTLALALATVIGPLAGGLISAFVTFAVAYGFYVLATRELEKLK